MAVDGNIKILFRRNLPGAGFNSAGVPVQGKTEVVGIFEVTTASGWTAAGEPLKPQDLGLTSIDFIDFSVVSVNDAATAPTNVTGMLIANYNYAAQTVIVNIINDSGSGTTDLASVTAGEACVLRFLAYGDSAAAPALV